MSGFAQWPPWRPRNGNGKRNGIHRSNGWPEGVPDPRADHPAGRARRTTNGHDTNGHDTNGHDVNGHATNGHDVAPRLVGAGVDEQPPLRVLAIGAHPDDIELGCAGALIEHRARGHQVAMLVMSQGESGPQHSSSRVCEQQDASDIIGADLYWGDFDDASIPDSRCVVDMIQDVMAVVRPDVIYTHTRNDSHQDHRAIALATLAAARRSSRVLQYEAPSSLQFTPALYVDIRDSLEGKLAALRAHVSQVLKNGLVDLEAIEAQARYRGFQARIRLAEAFEVERFVWDVGAVAGPGRDGHAVHPHVLLEEVR